MCSLLRRAVRGLIFYFFKSDGFPKNTQSSCETSASLAATAEERVIRFQQLE